MTEHSRSLKLDKSSRAFREDQRILEKHDKTGRPAAPASSSLLRFAREKLGLKDGHRHRSGAPIPGQPSPLFRFRKSRLHQPGSQIKPNWTKLSQIAFLHPSSFIPHPSAPPPPQHCVIPKTLLESPEAAFAFLIMANPKPFLTLAEDEPQEMDGVLMLSLFGRSPQRGAR